jgi:predicted transposase/invertase (TIGR01784 family)
MAVLKYKLTRDILFKMFFVKNPDLLKNLVSLILGIPTGSITYFNITNADIAPESIGKKFCHLDINMEVNAQRVNLEVQVDDEGDYPARSLYYWARGYSSALPEGGDYIDLPRTVGINILAFNLFKEFAGVYSEFRVLEVTRHTELADKMSLHYFELPKLPDVTAADADDKLKMWLALFNANTDEDLTEIAKIGGELMEQAVTAYKGVVGSKEFEEAERVRSLTWHNEASALNRARREGERLLIENMRQMGRNIEEIAAFTGFSVDRIYNILGL